MKHLNMDHERKYVGTTFIQSLFISSTCAKQTENLNLKCKKALIIKKNSQFSKINLE